MKNFHITSVLKIYPGLGSFTISDGSLKNLTDDEIAHFGNQEKIGKVIFEKEDVDTLSLCNKSNGRFLKKADKTVFDHEITEYNYPFNLSNESNTLDSVDNFCFWEIILNNVLSPYVFFKQINL